MDSSHSLLRAESMIFLNYVVRTKHIRRANMRSYLVYFAQLGKPDHFKMKSALIKQTAKNILQLNPQM